ncbi:hypothetical protein COCON_G00149180 [Conger conger]|uniref:Uncharacterized protein n=1 Tax=Conger conger TaxID=82655 RepID=A0A9Q1HVV0_CONCO|nr:hypothetical protein COCON_G00149180 [Conger conger]
MKMMKGEEAVIGVAGILYDSPCPSPAPSAVDVLKLREFTPQKRSECTDTGSEELLNAEGHVDAAWHGQHCHRLMRTGGRHAGGALEWLELGKVVSTTRSFNSILTTSVQSCCFSP